MRIPIKRKRLDIKEIPFLIIDNLNELNFSES